MKPPHYISEKKAAAVDLDRHRRLYYWRHNLRTLTMRRLLEPWTPQDDEHLKAMVAQGASIIRVAAALRRRHEMVRQRARKLGCRFPPLRIARRKWANTPNKRGEGEAGPL